jgi:pimeloyl-ACP methyl ester carboxylesterase
MGAAVAFSAASRYPQRCTGLVLSRLAWLKGSMSPQAVAAYAEAARLLQTEPSPQSALRKLEKSSICQRLAAVNADSGKSLLGQVRCVVSDSRMREAAVARLQHLPSGQPPDLKSAGAINVPTVIMATPNDPIHPFCFAEALAAAIPRASLVKLRPKQPNDGPHIQEVNSRIFRFLDSLWG